MNNKSRPPYPVAEPPTTSNLAVGLTKLESFAGLAMQGIVARQWYDAEGMAADAVTCARALLAELEKEVRA
jgi:hypothetical protein